MPKARLFDTVFFPDATRGVIRALDSNDIKSTNTPGILVNTYHLYREIGLAKLKTLGGIGKFMNWDGAIISDSGGFQVMSIVKKSGKKGMINDVGVNFVSEGREIFLTPEKSIKIQFAIASDMMVVLDEFTEPGASWEKAKESVDRTVLWAKRSKEEFEKQCNRLGFTSHTRPLLIGVVQGGDYLDLRKECAIRLSEIGFDGFGYGGWPIDKQGNFNYEVAKVISDNAPRGYLLYGLGVGKPEDIVGCHKLGYQIYDCVLPTRDARHGRLYTYNAKSLKEINLEKNNFYSYLPVKKSKYLFSKKPVSLACDCELCKNFSIGYLSYLFKQKDVSAFRLASIHNLRFYSLLMENLKKNAGKK